MSIFSAYFQHLTRMKKDLVYMNVKLSGLKKEMVAQMLEKFGQVVNISELEYAMFQKSFQKTQVNELEEIALKKMVYDLRIKLTDVKSQFVDIYNTWNVRIVFELHLLGMAV